jgi:ribonuclease R
MRDHLGSVFTGTVSSVTNFGMFVSLDDLYVEGLVHISELGKDYYHFDATKHQLLGERTGQRYRLGDRVQVRVVKVDMESTKIDFVLDGIIEQSGRHADRSVDDLPPKSGKRAGGRDTHAPAEKKPAKGKHSKGKTGGKAGKKKHHG